MAWTNIDLIKVLCKKMGAINVNVAKDDKNIYEGKFHVTITYKSKEN